MNLIMDRLDMFNEAILMKMKVKDVTQCALECMEVSVSRGKLISRYLPKIQGHESLMTEELVSFCTETHIDDLTFPSKYDTLQKKMLSFMAEKADITEANIPPEMVFLILNVKKDISLIDITVMTHGCYLYEMIPDKRIVLLEVKAVSLVRLKLLKCLGGPKRKEWFTGESLHNMNIKQLSQLVENGFDVFNVDQMSDYVNSRIEASVRQIHVRQKIWLNIALIEKTKAKYRHVKMISKSNDRIRQFMTSVLQF